MNCEYLIIVIILILFLIPYIREDYQQQTYKVYKQSSDSLIPKHKYRMWYHPYEWAYRADNFPLEHSKNCNEPENAPMGACLTQNKLWTCSI
jgi:hypothetical protein